MKKNIFMIVNILIYLGVYMAMQFVVGIGLLLYFAVNEAVLGASADNIQLRSAEALEQNTSQIILIAISLSLIVYIVIFALKKRSLLEQCRFKLIGVKEIAMIVLASAGLSMIIDSVLSFIPVDQWFPSHQEIISSITAGKSFILTLLTVGVAVPVFEEILLRGLVFNELRKNMHVAVAIIIQAIIFGVYHWNMLQAIYASILGIFLGLVYVWTKSLWAPIVIHIFFNSSSLILSRLSPTINILLYLFIGIILFSAGITLTYRITHRNNMDFN
jgi:membrane protease YdiL (CAAX protease family)